MRGDGLLAAALELLLPRGCVACGSWIPDGTGPGLVCPRCRARLRPAAWPRCARCHHPVGTGRTHVADCLECRGWPPELTRARYAFVLDAPATDLVHALKYEGWSELAAVMAEAMAAAVDEVPDLVVPIPTTPDRLRERGYNQAALLAVRVAEIRGWPCAELLARPGGGASQISLGPRERARNVRGAFNLVRDTRGRVADARILLVDDVLTTGATASAAARTLAPVGARSVSLLTFARALPLDPRRRD